MTRSASRWRVALDRYRGRRPAIGEVVAAIAALVGSATATTPALAVVGDFKRDAPTILFAALGLAAVGGSVIGFALRGLRSGTVAAGPVPDPHVVGAETAWELDHKLRFSRLVVAPPGATGGRPLIVDGDRGRTWAELRLGTASQSGLDDIASRCARHEVFRDVIVARDDGVEGMRYFAISGAPRTKPGGKLVGYAGVVRDVSAVFAREESLRKARREAEEASAAKTAYIATMSHELRSPLNAVVGFAEVMSREVLGPMGSQRYLTYARDISTAGQHMLALVGDILGMARLESGQQILEESEFDLETTIAEAVALVRLQAEAGQHGIELKLEAWPRLRADPRAIRQILVNLLGNAIKFSRPAGRVVIDTAFVPEEGGALRIGVRDFGIGIAAPDIPRLTAPFVQLQAGRTRGDGSGLGLAIVRHLIELHGGRLDIASKLDEGTTATVVLPASRVLARALPRREGQEAVPS
ncbi:MAG: HAMP domain-containing histidine kinase [Phreatobacter sp.]|uniref:PAS domain-containing sensor histidine kinase n=1 Tax=Phreatobacter sp. TaxID=1966341 RepID=UPI001A423106|nr:HAMP domain-containing sensor histidine kinase [Phreatobacter sp.]MBL8571817.1 HAMP domain-containing histidine kinase [Phreatobacter sp.]